MKVGSHIKERKYILALLSILTIILLLTTLFACDGDLINYSLEIKTYPQKTEYYLQDDFDPSGIVLELKNEVTGDIKEIDSTCENLEFSGFDSTCSAESLTITALYKKNEKTLATASFNVTIKGEYSYAYKEKDTLTEYPTLETLSLGFTDMRNYDETEVYFNFSLSSFDLESEIFKIKIGDKLYGKDDKYEIKVAYFWSSPQNYKVELNYATKKDSKVSIPLSCIFLTGEVVEVETASRVYRYKNAYKASQGEVEKNGDYYYCKIPFSSSDLRTVYVKYGNIFSIEYLQKVGTDYVLPIPVSLWKEGTIYVYRYDRETLRFSRP